MTIDPDPRGIIASGLELDGLYPEEWRALFFDWAFGFKGEDIRAGAALLAARHGDKADHPLVMMLGEAAAAPAPAAKRGEHSGRRVRT